MATWWRELFGGYRDNPVTLRDFRVQFRNGRVVGLMLVFCLLSTLVAFLSYSSSVTSDVSDITRVQSVLSNTYSTVVTALYLLVVAFSALSSAFSVVAERQRKAMDLVFSSPFSPRRYVLGKVVAGGRYSVLLVALAFPAMATMVVAGGASPEDVLLHALLLALNALAFTCVAVAFASVARSFLVPFAATIGVGIVWFSFATGLGYAGLMAASSSFGGSGLMTTPWYAALLQTTPILGTSSPSLTVDLFGWLIPAWTVATVVLLLVTRLALVGAVAALETPKVLADVNLRLHGLVVVALMSVLVGVSLPNAVTTSMELQGVVMGASFGGLFLLPTAFLTAAFGKDREQTPPDRTAFDFRRWLRAHSGGALAYGLALMVVWWLPIVLLRPYLLQPNGTLAIAHTFILMALTILFLRVGSTFLKSAAVARIVTVVAWSILIVFGSVALSQAGVPSILRPLAPRGNEFEQMAWIDMGLTLLATCFGYYFLERSHGKP